MMDYLKTRDDSPLFIELSAIVAIKKARVILSSGDTLILTPDEMVQLLEYMKG